eukprot:CAMPEP_0172190146 /NCGR_PEP_ID=MMETSP1050-20130122/22944_1 /TAXON_ID=233186 /ORGANISM="Cryptomonas curvata, Strain CCAP979/52" /LENGTH=465 /DNA_ID=CAMNT_0012864973 /DNA_START=24 /DNA_END=1418 /DNA_ORIENTATION=-
MSVQEMPSWKRHMLFTLACSHVLLASGAAYGWTALRPVLMDSGVFDSFPELEQAAMLNSVATMGIAANALCKLPLGIFLDSLGPRYTAMVGAVLLSGGSLAMAIGDKQSQHIMMWSYFAIGVAGPFLQMPCFQFAELYGLKKESARATLVLCFELSTGVFWVFGQLHDYFKLNHAQLFIGYSAVGLFSLTTSAFLWPDRPYKSVPPPPSTNHPPQKGEHKKRAVVPTSTLLDKSLVRQIFSFPFFYVTLFFSIHNFCQGFVLATLGPQIEEFFTADDGKQAQTLISSFTIILPLGFLPMMLFTATGLAAYILARHRLAFIFVSLLCTIYGLLLLVHVPAAYLALFVIFPVARQFVFASYFSYSANTFGYASFGRIAGVSSTFAGLAQLTQTKVVAMIKDPNSSLSWDKVDLWMGLTPILLLGYPVASYVAQCCAAPPDEHAAPAGAADGLYPNEDDLDAPLLGTG